MFVTLLLFRLSGSEFSTHLRMVFSEYFQDTICIQEKNLENRIYKFQDNLSRPRINDAKARYRVAAHLFGPTDTVYRI
jgi:hypothetical protein